ncbi:hypothetical protein R1T08_09700 [Streptomyces sp. SBC-4]|nr:hypothetical protein [Streptomyces sp. SBC-4]MDV5144502.1 hypothetical protein [Streptomyces sp. SBC-4]
MTAEHPRPTSRITDALLPTPPAPEPAAARPRTPQHPVTASPSARIASERPTAAGDPPPPTAPPRPAATEAAARSSAPQPPATASPSARIAAERPTTAGDPLPPTAPPRPAAPEAAARSGTPRLLAPLASPSARIASERPTAAGDPPPPTAPPRAAVPARSTPRTAPAPARPAGQGGTERPTAAGSPPPLPPMAPPRPASAAAPKAPATPVTQAPAYPPAPAPEAPVPAGTPPTAPQRPAAPEAPRSATAGGALRQPGPASSSVPARPASPPTAGGPVVPPAAPAPGPTGRTSVTSEAGRGSASPRPAASAPLSPRQAPAPARAWASPSGAGDLPAVETTTRLRPIRDTPRTAHATRPAPVTAYGYGLAGALPPEAPVETTTRLRPVRERRSGRVLTVTACVVLGVGLIGGALAGIWLASADPARPAEPAGYTEAQDLWHNAPVDTLFPRTLAGPGAGPGAAGRTWTRIVVAPDTPCSPAVLAKGMLATLTPLGCERVLRATYTDATASSVITVGLVFTRADAATQRTLGRGGLTARLGQDVPPALSGPSTVAARFGARQRASWWLSAPADLPVVVTAVSGFADGRAVDRPQPADQAMARGRTDATAQSGLGHEAKGITARFEALLRKTVAATVKEKENTR